MSYQTSLNFAPVVPVRRSKPTFKARRIGGNSKQSPSAGPSERKCMYDDGHDDDCEHPSTKQGPRGPSQLDALSYTDSDEGGSGGTSNARHGAKTNAKDRRRAAAAKLRRQKEAGKRRSDNFWEDTDDEGDVTAKAAKTKKANQRKRLGGGKNKKKKRRVVEDSDDEDDDMDNFIVHDESSANDEEDGGDSEIEEEIILTSKGKKGKARASNDGAGSDDEEPMSHAALAFQMQLDHQAAKQDEELLAEVMMANRPLSEDEAFRVWLEDLALQAESFLIKSNNGGKGGEGHASSLRQQKAASQIERPLCTRRESTLGSSAWRPEFRDELKHRPVYQSFELHQLAVPDGVRHCGACGRSSHNITHRIEFSGPRYNADQTWQSSRYLKHADWEACLRRTDEDRHRGNEKEDDAEATTFYVGGHCRARTELYHSLLHFKYRIFDEILGLLSGDHSNVAIRIQLKANGQVLDQFLRKKQKGEKGDGDAAGKGEGGTLRPMSVDELMSNGGFVERQQLRCRNLTEESEEKWGGHKVDVVQGGGKAMPKKKVVGQGSLLRMLGGAASSGGTHVTKKGNSTGQKHQSILNFSPSK